WSERIGHDANRQQEGKATGACPEPCARRNGRIERKVHRVADQGGNQESSEACPGDGTECESILRIAAFGFTTIAAASQAQAGEDLGASDQTILPAKFERIYYIDRHARPPLFDGCRGSGRPRTCFKSEGL